MSFVPSSLRFVAIVSGLAGLAPAAMAEQPMESPWSVDLRAASIMPDERTSTSIGGKVNVDAALSAELAFKYHMNHNFAVALGITDGEHDVLASGTSGGDLDIGQISTLLPTAMLQYHINPEGLFRPYVGLGAGYLFIYDETRGADVTDVSYDDAFLYGLQAGVGYHLGNRWEINLDVKKFWANTDADLNRGAVRADLDLDPWIIGLGTTYDF